MRKKKFALGAAALLLCLGAVPAFAAPSIGDIQSGASQTALVRADRESPAAQALARTEIFCSQAELAQYRETDAQGNTVETKLSRMIAASQSVQEETGRNGQALVDEIPTVRELLAFLDQPEDKTYNLDNLEQLTYMMDLKYTLTGTRVTVGERLPNRTGSMRDGKITVTLDGGEVLRAGRLEDFVILLVKPDGTGYTFLTMKEYDSETGVYTVEFPYIGSFMVMQVMRR